MAELVDAADLKSADGDVVGVQVPLPPSARDEPPDALFAPRAEAISANPLDRLNASPSVGLA